MHFVWLKNQETKITQNDCSCDIRTYVQSDSVSAWGIEFAFTAGCEYANLHLVELQFPQR